MWKSKYWNSIQSSIKYLPKFQNEAMAWQETSGIMSYDYFLWLSILFLFCYCDLRLPSPVSLAKNVLLPQKPGDEIIHT